MLRRLLFGILLSCSLLVVPVWADGISIGGRLTVAGGDPLPDAEVVLLPLLDPLGEASAALAPEPLEPAARALTDSKGQFELIAPHAGLWTVRVAAPGFVPLEAALRPLLEPVELTDAELFEDVGAKIKIVDEEGQPVPGALVLLRGARGRYRFLQSAWTPPLRSARTAEDGRVRLARGDRESFSVSASTEEGLVAERRGLHGTAATLALDKGVPQRLEVRSAEGRALPGVFVAAGERMHPLGTTDDAGRITVMLDRQKETALHFLATDGRRLETRLAADPKYREKPRTVEMPQWAAISARLIDLESRRPISGGLVWDGENPTLAAISDAAGGVVLSGAAGHRLRIGAGAPGYLQADPLEFQLNEDGRPGPSLALRPAAALTGKVVDADGDAIAGADVSLQLKQSPGMMRIEIGGPDREVRATTNGKGEFRLSPIDPSNSYDLKARAQGYAPAEVAVTGLEPRRTRSGVRVEMDSGRSVTGRLVDGDANAIAGASIEIEPGRGGPGTGMMRIVGPGDGAPAFTTLSDRNGNFEIGGLAAGKFDLEAKRSGFAKHSVPGIELSEEAEPLDLGELVMTPGERIEGLVHDPQGQPIEGVQVFVVESGPMTFSMGGPPGAAGEPAADAVSDAAGWFSIVDLAAGEKYSLSFRRPGYVEHGLNSVEPPQLEPLDVRLEPSSRVVGMVLDPAGEPIAGARVNLSRTRSMEMGGMAMQMMMMEDQTSDRTGQFVFEDQEPGVVSLSAVASGFQEARLDQVEIPKGEDLEGVELPLEAGAILAGQILAPDGRAAIGATIRTAGESSGPMRMDGVSSDGNGNYRLEGLAPGDASIEATHPDYPRVVKDLELNGGVNSLDLNFEGGQEVSGRVTDPAGNPVVDAAARLVPAGRMWGGPETRSRPDGTFLMPGVQNGDYRLWVEAEGFAAFDGQMQVSVEGEPVQGLGVQLDPGAAIAGRIAGIEPERFSGVTVRADGHGGFGFSGSGVDHQGNYRIEHLKPGNYDLVATLSDSAKQARAEAVIEAGMQEARVDLTFGGGLTLSGRAVQGDLPVGGSTVFAAGVDIDHEGWTQTDHQGIFALDGLEPGRYRVQLRNFQTGLAYEEEIDIATSREIVLEVPTARVAGRIVATEDRQPLPGVTVTLDPSASSGEGRMRTHTGTTDLNGQFTIGNVSDGSWQLSFRKKGYAAGSREVTVQSGQGIDDLRLTMDATEGLTLEARLPSGAPPAELLVAVLDPAGVALVNGNYATGEGGRVRLTSVPPGTWDLVVSAAGSATANLRAVAPGASIPVALEPPCSLKVTVPELRETNSVATVQLRAADGRPYRTLGWTALPRSEWRISGGQVEFSSLPPGSWTVSVSGADGRSWSGDAVTSPGSTAELLLE